MDAVKAYRKMYLIRHVEEEIARRYYPTADKTQSPMRCPVHLSIGQEGVAVGVAMAVPKGSHAYSTHRCHAHYLAWGGDLDAMVAELYGKASGCSRGLAGSMHLHDESVGFMGTSAIVGSSVSLAVGDAFSARCAGNDRITVAFGGDAVLETGQFWEALNFARLHSLRILFVIEDNGLATATPKSKRQSKVFDPSRMNIANSDSAADVFHMVEWAIKDGWWPLIVKVPTRRFYVHVGTDRMPEYAIYPEDDPLQIAHSDAANYVLANNPSYNARLARMVVDAEQPKIRERVAAVFERAEAAPWP